MIEVDDNLFVGDGMDFEAVRASAEWSIVTCAKEPWHREALGYVGRAAPRDDPEYLFARRDRRLILNMVDADRAAYFHPDMMNTALDFIAIELGCGQKVLLHCNQGGSRAPGLALLWLMKRSRFPITDPYDVVESKFRNELYKKFDPSDGIREYVRTDWRRTNLEVKSSVISGEVKLSEGGP